MKVLLHFIILSETRDYLAMPKIQRQEKHLSGCHMASFGMDRVAAQWSIVMLRFLSWSSVFPGDVGGGSGGGRPNGWGDCSRFNSRLRVSPGEEGAVSSWSKLPRKNFPANDVVVPSQSESIRHNQQISRPSRSRAGYSQTSKCEVCRCMRSVPLRL